MLRSLPVTVDIVCLQETHCVSSADCSLWFSSSGNSSCISPGSNHSRGCIVLYRPSLSLVNSWSDEDGRSVQCEFSVRGKLFRVCCFCAPNRNPERGQFRDGLPFNIDPSVATVLVGDFITVFDRQVDRRGSDPLDSRRESSARLEALFDACCAALSTFGDTYTLTLLALPGPVGMAP